MSHADILRTVAAYAAPGGIPPHPNAEALLAGADALDTVDRVRDALRNIARVKADSDAASVYDHDIPEWHEATADALEYALELITEALEGDTK